MPTVRYEAPRSVADAVRLMQADSEARVLAGGTDLLIQFRAGWRQPSAFIDVKHIPELIAISERDDGVRIGASAAAASICEHPALNRFWPGLVEATHLIGSTQIQGRASLGGNLCNASPAADSICALIVNRARCVIAGPSGERSVPAEAFCTAPGRTVLERGEILVAIDLPRPAARTADAYLRLIPRSEMDIAVAGAAVSVTLDSSGTCTAARVAIGAVAPTALLGTGRGGRPGWFATRRRCPGPRGRGGESPRAADRRQAGDRRVSASSRWCVGETGGGEGGRTRRADLR